MNVIDPTLKRIEKVVLRGHAHGASRQEVIVQLKSMGVTKAQMDMYQAYVKDSNHETNNSN